jgi:diguanylate cyclase (GGDEF)-like protein/PAS domain S-box-containing protein
MTTSKHSLRRRPGATTSGVLAVSAAWIVAMLSLSGAPAAQHLSNVGLTAAALAAGVAAIWRARRDASAARFWGLLGAALLSWSIGQAAWTWYESVLGQEVPFPSLADAGYLGLPPLAAAALLSLPLAAQTLAGRARTVLDGLMVASSLLVCSWVLVLGPIFEAGGEGALRLCISLAYPIGDVIVMTMVVYTWLRSRQVEHRISVSLPLVGTGLLAFAVADSGFSYLTTTGLYSSGSLIDIGWFLGFMLMFVAAVRRPRPTTASDGQEMPVRPLGNLLPYAAVMAALVTSAVEVWRTGHADVLVSWLRTLLMVLLVVRQVLTLSENHSLTRNLEQRVLGRTAELSASQQRFAALVQHSSDVVTVVDRNGCVTYQSASIERILGYTPEGLLGRSVFEMTHEDHAAELASALEHAAGKAMRIHTVTTSWRHASGRECQVEVTITNLLDNPHVHGLVLNTRDVTERFVLERQLTQQAFTDALTGLPNRALFKDRLQHALSRRHAVETNLAVLFLDLDGFKAVNDTLGHSTGDEILVQVAMRLRGVVRSSDTVARFGGDEFAVLVEDPEGAGYALGLAQRINDAIRQPFDVAAERVHLATSVGIARFDAACDGAEQLLRNADLAMYQAKASRAGGYALFHPDMHAGLVERVRLESDLRQAVDRGEFFVHYQPMFSMRTGQITGVEALLRWRHPDRGTIGPAEFIPLAEATGLIWPIGLWVLRESCEQVARWQQQLPSTPPLRVSVNVSPRQLLTGDLVGEVERVLSDTGLSAADLTLEMTENVLIDNGDATLATLNGLKALGVRLAIDDFGTGYSSLSYLHRFPVDVLKIDRSFVERLSNGDDSGLVGAILRLGQTMRLETVAEGIERPQEMLFLRRQGCTTGQGFHFSPPVSGQEMGEMLLDQHTVTAASVAATTA